jgi:predicted deacetylase
VTRHYNSKRPSRSSGIASAPGRREAGRSECTDISEFAGVPEIGQRDKLDRAIKIFLEQGVVPDVWVAPGHSFDWTTIRILREAGIRTISDGFTLFPHVDPWGTCWMPQQLWRFRRLPFGVWTVCLHHNQWPEVQLESVSRTLAAFRHRITSASESIARYSQRPKATLERAFEALYPRLVVAKRLAQGLLRGTGNPA